jgi:hypothetical protein
MAEGSILGQNADVTNAREPSAPPEETWLLFADAMCIRVTRCSRSERRAKKGEVEVVVAEAGEK